MKDGHKRDRPSRGSLSAGRTDVRTRLGRTKTEKNKAGVLRVGAVHKLPGKGRLLPNTLLLTTLSCVVAVVVDGLPCCMPGVLIWSLQERWSTFGSESLSRRSNILTAHRRRDTTAFTAVYVCTFRQNLTRNYWRASSLSMAEVNAQNPELLRTSKSNGT